MPVDLAAMNTFLGPIRTTLWFAYQAITVGGLGLVWFAVPFAILLSLAVVSLVRVDKSQRSSLWVLLVLPAIWIFVGLWGGTFWVDWQHHPVHNNPSWVSYPIFVAPWLAIAATIFLALRLVGARLLVSAFGLINIYFTVFFSFMSGMAITGDWL
ncbi:MAG: hypothetical protein EPO08_00105 [Rhodospirillaceae bacterium]|nr:MAG: hypothetical protein EPO08_00105 [Rhodospirillaceae bacterium]